MRNLLINKDRPFPRRSLFVSALLSTLAVVVFGGCGSSAESPSDGSMVNAGQPRFSLSYDETAFIDTLQSRTFRFFWDRCDPVTGLAPDRWPTESFASVAATGFALTAYPIGVERGEVTREAAARRTLKTLRFLWTAPQGDAPQGVIGHQGLFYHFVDMATGERFGQVELSTIDTALLLAGALFCQSYFDGASAQEDSIRTLAEALYRRADWNWASPRPPSIGHGWTPEQGHLPYDWRGYNEGMLLYLLALASPTHPVPAEAWDVWLEGYQWGEFMGQEHVGFGPLFGHQYTHVWVDLRGIQDAGIRDHGLDYMENSRRAVLAQHAYALANPGGWVGYGPRLWGWTACDGPVHATVTIDGRERRFETYSARGVSFREGFDDGTVCPSALAGSLPFAPELIVPTLMAMREDHGDRLFGAYGFFDSLNPTFTVDMPVQHGWVDPVHGWYDDDYLGIDQGPIVAMIENQRNGLIWRTMRGNPHLVRGLRRAGFTGGWLDSLPTAGP